MPLSPEVMVRLSVHEYGTAMTGIHEVAAELFSRPALTEREKTVLFSRSVATGPLPDGNATRERDMSLEEKLAAVREASAKRIPPERLSVMHAATEQLRHSGILDRVIKPGTSAPDFTLNDQNGNAVGLSTLAARGPVLMSVFRGFW